MKNLHALALLLTLLVGCTADSGHEGTPTDDSPASTLASLRGQWVVINYWAKWCKPCIKEIPELNELNQRYTQVTVLGVNFDGASGEELALQLRQLDIQFATLPQDPSFTLKTPRPLVLPTTIIIEPSGAISQILVGPQTLESLALATHQDTRH